jgi:DNA-binding NarL/FixJ family response regulator
MAKIALVDDHVLLRNGLAGLVKSLGHEVMFEADNGKHLIEKLQTNALPEIILLDINMPEMDGYETVKWIKKNHPGVKVLALSMYDNETAIIRMLKYGAKGYILKDSDPIQLKNALEDLVKKGFYYSELVSGKLISAINKMDSEGDVFETTVHLNEREKDFLRHSCSEFTYK